LTLRQEDFDRSCAQLMQLVEADYAPDLIIGIRTGGLFVAEAMRRAASAPRTVLALTCRRTGTAVKSRLPMLRTILTALPRPTVDLLRRIEHRLTVVPRRYQANLPRIDPAEIDAIARWMSASSVPAQVLVADDAVDSGTTLQTALQSLYAVCPPETVVRSAAITQTLEQPAVRPDYVLFHGTLCRFPWSFDAPA
jgi:hypoxanthine phosphoribosyltransferase